jgi:hypothetical protein
MPVEILTVCLSEESIEAVARHVALYLEKRNVGNQVTTQSNPGSSQNPQDANGPGSGQQGDPWLNQGGTPPQQGQQQQGGQNCAHGAMMWQPPGTNRNTGESYSGYWKCPLQRGAQGRCRNVYV